jgi:outer membrane protein W
MNRHYIIAALMGLSLSLTAQADEAQSDPGFWSNIKTDWLGLAPGAKPFYFRAGYTLLAPDSSSTEVVLSDVGGIAELAISNGPIAGSGAAVEETDFPSVIVGWQLPWGNGQWAVETILALPLTVEFTTTGTLKDESIAPFALGNIPTGVPALGEEFGEAKALPPVVTLVYRFLPGSSIRPYVGGGVAMLFAYDAEVTNPVLTAVSTPELEIDPAVGYAVQGGVEFRFWKDWWINADLKFIGGLETTATVKDIWVETPGLPTYEVARVGNATMDVTVDPWVYHIGVGFNF